MKTKALFRKFEHSTLISNLSLLFWQIQFFFIILTVSFCLNYENFVLFLDSLHYTYWRCFLHTRHIFFTLKETKITTNFLWFYFVLWYRKQFIQKNQILASKVLHKEESISFIKFIGRQYDFLTSIMEKINICYSLQVKLLFSDLYVYS